MAKRLKELKIFRDRSEINIQYPQKQGKPPRVDTYITMRAGISWPSANSPSYYCIFGQKKEPTLTDKKPLVLLAEGEHHPMEKFFERLVLNANRLYCKRLFANTENNKSFEDSLLKFVRERKIDNVRPWDSSQFEDLQHGAALVRQYKTDRALEIPEGTILGKQVTTMTPEDLKDKPEERFYAVMALIRVLESFEHYPGGNKGGGFTGFTNFKHRERSGSEDSGNYEEIFVR
jgi:hypothetical protein